MKHFIHLLSCLYSPLGQGFNLHSPLSSSYSDSQAHFYSGILLSPLQLKHVFSDVQVAQLAGHATQAEFSKSSYCPSGQSQLGVPVLSGLEQDEQLSGSSAEQAPH